MVEREDAILIQQCLGGDQRAFETLVEKYQKPMFNAALRIIDDYDDAADVTQAAFIKAYENLRQFDGRYKFFSWLYRITVNGSLNFINARQRLATLPEDTVSSEKNADEVFSDEDSVRIVRRALMELTPDYRAVIVLSHFRELSYKEISDVLGISEKKVKSRLFSARQMLKSILSKNGV